MTHLINTSECFTIPLKNLPSSSHMPAFAHIISSSRNALLDFASNSAWKILYLYFTAQLKWCFFGFPRQLVFQPVNSRQFSHAPIIALIKLHFILHIYLLAIPLWLTAPLVASVYFPFAIEVNIENKCLNKIIFIEK